MWICLSVPKDLANLWTDMVLLYSVISPVQRRFIAILETLPPRSKEKFAQKILTCYPVLQGCPNVFFLRLQLKFEGGGGRTTFQSSRTPPQGSFVQHKTKVVILLPKYCHCEFMNCFALQGNSILLSIYNNNVMIIVI